MQIILQTALLILIQITINAAPLYHYPKIMLKQKNNIRNIS